MHFMNVKKTLVLTVACITHFSALAWSAPLVCKVTSHVNFENENFTVDQTLTLNLPTGTLQVTSVAKDSRGMTSELNKTLVSGAFCTEAAEIDNRLSSCFLQSSEDLWPIVKVSAIAGFLDNRAFWDITVRSPEVRSLTEKESALLPLNQLPGETAEVKHMFFPKDSCQWLPQTP
jgi:hypothetical protein